MKTQTLPMSWRLCIAAIIVALGAPLYGAPTGSTDPDTWISPGIDRARLLVEDEINELAPDAVYRVGHPFDVRMSPDTHGSWETLEDGSRRWRLKVQSPDALWLVLGLGKFSLQEGASLRLYTPDRSTELGPFDHTHIKPHGELWFPPIEGDSVVLDLSWPAERVNETPHFLLTRVSHGYKPLDPDTADDPLGSSDSRDLGDSGSCNIDVLCPLADDWQDIKQGVVHILRNGTSWCSGSLIATTARDCQPLVLTAAHCFVESDAPSLTFRFNYERPNCGSGNPGVIQTVTGGTFRSRNAPSDMYLVEMDSPPPLDANAYFNGWNRTNTAATESWGIHHPRGDAKKISFNDDALIDGTNYGPDHWRVTEWEQGTTEPTSSGSPLFDQNQRIVGQLHGGTASCSSITWDEYGKVFTSWTGGGSSASRLSDWLDPDNSGELAIDGIDYASCLTPQPRLAAATVVTDDASNGNGNGVLESGERVVLDIEASNGAGTLDATSVTGQLSSLHPDVSVLTAGANYPTIAQTGAEYPLSSYEIEIGSNFVCGDTFDLRLDLTASEAPGAWSSDLSFSTGTAVVATAYEDSMESGANGWLATELTGANIWSQTTSESNSPSTSWFVADIPTVADSVITSPAVLVPAGANLFFNHLVRSESTYDGGVIEISTDGTNWTDLGPSIVSGGYNTTISTQYSSPIGGRSAWSGTLGTSTTWPQVEVDLSAWANQTVQIRWRFATDSSVNEEGWYIDDVRIQETSFDCAPLLAAPGEASAAGSTPLRLAWNGTSYDLSWSAPQVGGPVDGYRLYSQSLNGFATPPSCEADMGAGLSGSLPTMSTNSAFLIVAHNAAGEGSYGQSSSGARSAALATCP